ncbi:MAG: hypothetical protein H7231_04325 [Rhodoferax sp.]|nr:hypothetical protein [Actinomycetota bacterium]
MLMGSERRGFLLALAGIMALLAVAGIVRLASPDDVLGQDRPAVIAASDRAATSGQTSGQTAGQPRRPPPVTGRIFDDGRFLVAYYGTAQTGALGVLGETDPDTAFRRLARAAAPFERPAQPVRLVYELIVTVADDAPGPRAVYSHDIPRAEVQQYVEAARRHGVLLLLDVQPGRDSFLDVARRWAWALRDPGVGLALDPEWRMGRHELPGRTIGSVDAPEVNRVSTWLVALQEKHRLPQKLFVLHQFRTDMIEHVGQVRVRPSLAMVQQVDGFGTPAQKRATYHEVAAPSKFVMGLKLFYDEDVDRLNATEVHRIRPKVRFVSFQ